MRLVLIRHAHSEANAAGVLSGRLPNVHLSEKGIEQANNLARRLGAFPISEMRISPMERCFETVHPWINEFIIPKFSNFEAVIDPDLTEVDYGTWSGRKLSVLSKNKLWKTVQESPSRMYFPSGEGIAQMQSRAMQSVHELVSVKKKGAAVIVSHGDVIKSIIASALGMHLDEFQRIIIDPASVSILEYSSIKPRVILLNDSRATVTDLLIAAPRSKNLLGGGSGR
ncbi:phoE Broad specificity phosphatase PhoE and related phosphatases [Candidatus Nanopelagicaceae bacterium]